MGSQFHWDVGLSLKEGCEDEGCECVSRQSFYGVATNYYQKLFYYSSQPILMIWS